MSYFLGQPTAVKYEIAPAITPNPRFIAGYPFYNTLLVIRFETISRLDRQQIILVAVGKLGLV